ncbi:metal ABC transporter permease [Fusibacter tunisiensis]|uniref:Zinc transport system permease protein n=1 Tax=Fusibacter tunisiensis TaxID=1008308 RepID=A0ABS2MPE3_9FIRM|nr:metal ABC transporter permease [Fusibacter tunisiensis]MBM7561259.1 zinc transport system permease protein [Fusibacter tunisiensis]
MNSTINLIQEALSYGFMQRALIVGVLIGLSSAMLGIFLVLKKFSMIGDGLAHVSFATVAIALFLGASPLFVSIPIVTVSSILIMNLNEKAGIHGDAAIGLVSSFSVALGVLISSVSGGFNVDLFSYLFGSILAIQKTDLWLSVILAIGVIFTVIFYYNDLFAITHDEAFSSVIGIPTKRRNYLIATLTSVTIVLGIRVVGTMLISSMIIFPTVSALQISKNFKSTIIIAAIISVFSVVVGLLGSYVLNLPSGAAIVMINGIILGIMMLYKGIVQR